MTDSNKQIQSVLKTEHPNRCTDSTGCSKKATKAALKMVNHLARQHSHLSQRLTSLSQALSDTQVSLEHLHLHQKQISDKQERMAMALTRAVEESSGKLNGRLDHLEQGLADITAAQTDALSKEQMVTLGETLIQAQEQILEKVTQAESQSNMDILVQLGTRIIECDEFADVLRRLSAKCPEGCAAARLAAENLERVEGMRAGTVNLLAMHDVNLIDSVERFDAIRHRPVGTCPRPGDARGDGYVQRIGFVYTRNSMERVLKPALIVLYDDVEV